MLKEISKSRRQLSLSNSKVHRKFTELYANVFPLIRICALQLHHYKEELKMCTFEKKNPNFNHLQIYGKFTFSVTKPYSQLDIYTMFIFFQKKNVYIVERDLQGTGSSCRRPVTPSAISRL